MAGRMMGWRGVVVVAVLLAACGPKAVHHLAERDGAGRVPARSGGIVPIGFAPTSPSGSTGFQWPVPGGAVTSPFGRRDNAHHDGIDVQAPIGTAVRAARGGAVLFAGALRGYGNLVILDHGGGLATIYAHNQQNLARVGQRVRSGQTIAVLGATGQASSPHLHFEVRQHNVARDPLRFLPPMSVASRRTPGGP